MYFLFQLYSSALFGSSLYFLTVEILTVFIHSSSDFIEHLYDPYLELILGRLLISTFFPQIMSFLYLEHILFCHLILPNSVVYVYVLDSSVMSPDLGEVASMQETSCGIQQRTPLWSPEQYALGVPLCELCMPFCCGEADCCGQGGRHIYRLWWLQVYWRLGRLLVWLAAQSLGGGVSLLLTCQRAGPGHHVAIHMAGGCDTNYFSWKLIYLILDCPKSSFKFTCKHLWKTLNELFGQPKV